MTTDTLVLGAGIVGVSAALHLQERGQSVAIIDRSAPGEGASFGNAGLLERSSVIPYAIPRDLRTLLNFATNRAAAVHYDPAFLPRIRDYLRRALSHPALAALRDFYGEHGLLEERTL